MLEERKRFAADLAERDRVRASAPRRVDGPALPTLDLTTFERYKRWWLERYSLEEIREMAAALEPLRREVAA